MEADGAEVARIEIDHRPRRTPYQVPVPTLVRELHYIEASHEHLGEGIGTAVVQDLVDELSDARPIPLIGQVPPRALPAL